MSEEKSSSESYSLGLSIIAIAIVIFFIPNEYKFSFSNTISMVLLMISSVIFAFSLQETMNEAKNIWDNLGTSFLIFYIIYFIVLGLKYIGLLNPYTSLILLLISFLPFFGFFSGLTNLIGYLFKNKNNKTSFFDALIKLIPTFLPVISLILKLLKLI